MYPLDLSDARWFKSTRSGNNGTCVEVAFLGCPTAGHRVATRDSKDPAGPMLSVAPDAWSGFLSLVKIGRFDLS